MSLILVARLFVIAVLAYSGLSKLGSPKVAEAARDLGLSSRIAKWVGQWLAPVELIVAVLILLGPTAYAGAMAALVLFLAFTALIAWNLWQGLRPACACFGEATQAISNWTLVRDLGFVALSAFVVVSGPIASQGGVVSDLAEAISSAGSSTALALMALAQTAILIGVWGRRGVSGTESATPAPLTALSAPAPVLDAGWPPGTLAPGFDLPSLDGSRVTLADLVARDRTVILLFTDPKCRPCQALLPEIARWQDRYRGVLTIALLTRGSALENREKAEEFGVETVLLQGGSEVAAAYQAEGTPMAVTVDRRRRIASRLAAGAVDIRHLVEAWAERSRQDPPVSVMSSPPPADATRLLVGDPAPPFKLDAVRGGQVDLADFGGRLTVLIFWSPTCGFCRRFAPDLLEREKAQTESSVQMVFVAEGTLTANEAEGFASPVLLQEDRSVSRAYGVNGTPSAVLVDAEGKVASAAAVGRAEIEALLNRTDLMTRAARRIVA